MPKSSLKNKNTMHQSIHSPLSPRHLLILLLAVVIPLLIAGEIAEHLLAEQRFAFETPMMLFIHEHFGPLFLYPAIALHWLGKWYVCAPLIVWLAIHEYRRRKNKSRAWFIVFSGLLPTLIMFAAKNLFNRPRPQLWPRIVQESGASFPSGHSTFAAAFAVMLVILYWHTPQRYPVCIAAVLLALLAGFSRMVLGVHFPTDVLVGWITGGSTVVLLYFSLRRQIRLPAK